MPPYVLCILGLKYNAVSNSEVYKPVIQSERRLYLIHKSLKSCHIVTRDQKDYFVGSIQS